MKKSIVNKIRNTRSPAKRLLLLVLVAVIIFVAYNLISDRGTVKVSQNGRPTIQEVLEASLVAERTGSFTGSGGYSVSGEASIVDFNGQKLLQFDDSFSSSSGPDLVVYLSKNNVQAGEALGEFVSLGSLSDKIGSQVYLIPENHGDFKSVVIWCRAFSANFGSAEL